MVERSLSRQAVAERLGCSVQTVRRLVEAGELKPPRLVSPGRCGHLESEVNEYLRSRPVAPLVERTAAANSPAARAKAAETRAARRGRTLGA